MRTERGAAGQHADGNAEAAGQLGQPEEASEPGALPDALPSRNGVLAMAPAAGDENRADQEAHEEQGEIRERIHQVRRNRADSNSLVRLWRVVPGSSAAPMNASPAAADR